MSKTEEGQPHPLFPVDEGETVPVIHSILVARLNQATGKLQWCKRPFAPDELTELAQLSEMFGGGSFVLKARGPDNKGNPNCWYSGEAQWDLPGAPKPLNEEDSPNAPRPSPLGQAAPAVGDFGGAPGVLQLMLGMMQQSTAMMTSMMAQTTQVLMAVLQSGQTGSQTHVQTMAQQHQAHSEQMAGLMKAMVEAQHTPQAGGTIEQILDAVKTGIELKTGANEGQGGPTELESLVQGASVFAELAKAGGGGPPSLPPNGGQGAP